jgi:hypothetical protein
VRHWATGQDLLLLLLPTPSRTTLQCTTCAARLHQIPGPFDKADVDTSWDISTEEWIEVCKLNGPQNAANLESLFKETALHVGTTGSRSQGSRTLQIRPI